MITHIATADLMPHSDNPRFTLRQDVVDQLAALMSDSFDEAHALIVRPAGKVCEIVSGAHRHAAAVQAGLDAVPCFVREMSDGGAFMLLVTSNARTKLAPLERGKVVTEPPINDVGVLDISDTCITRSDDFRRHRHEIAEVGQAGGGEDGIAAVAVEVAQATFNPAEVQLLRGIVKELARGPGAGGRSSPR